MGCHPSHWRTPSVFKIVIAPPSRFKWATMKHMRWRLVDGSLAELVKNWAPGSAGSLPGGICDLLTKWNWLEMIYIDIYIYVCIWLVVWNHAILWLSIDWEFHNPNWRTHIFQRGRYTTNQIHIYIYIQLFMIIYVYIVWLTVKTPAGVSLWWDSWRGLATSCRTRTRRDAPAAQRPSSPPPGPSGVIP